MKPRLTLLIGVVFLVVASIFYGAPTLLGGHVDVGGTVMLVGLAAAMSLMAYVLAVGTASES